MVVSTPMVHPAVHGSTDGEQYSFQDVGGASTRCLVHHEGSHLGSRKPWPEGRKDGGQCGFIILYVTGVRAADWPLPST